MITEINDLEKYLRKKCPTFDWDTVNIFCCEKDNNGKQRHINFIKRPYELYNEVEFSMCITKYKDYIKEQNDSWIDISILGNKHRIIATLVYNTISRHTPINTKTNTYINISCDKKIPSLNESFLLVIDKTEKNLVLNNECPVCMIDLKNPKNEKITLPCFHKICKNCLFSSFQHKINTCPLCRHPILVTDVNV